MSTKNYSRIINKIKNKIDFGISEITDNLIFFYRIFIDNGLVKICIFRVIFSIVRVGVGNVDISSHYHAPTLRYWMKNATKTYFVAIYKPAVSGVNYWHDSDIE